MSQNWIRADELTPRPSFLIHFSPTPHSHHIIPRGLTPVSDQPVPARRVSINSAFSAALSLLPRSVVDHSAARLRQDHRGPVAATEGGVPDWSAAHLPTSVLILTCEQCCVGHEAEDCQRYFHVLCLRHRANKCLE